jgi:hypothetical protein
MKVFRKLINALGVLALFTPVLMSSGCAYLNKVIAKDSLNQGAIKQAQEFFKSATERDPNNPMAQLYYGATLVSDYKSLSDPERTQVANSAIDTYKKALDISGGNCKVDENARAYIAQIYDDLGNAEEWRNWQIKQAEASCSSKDLKRATYYSIAVKFWDCSYSQTTRYQDKANKDQFAYRNMDYDAAKADKVKAEDCITKGMEFVEKSLAVDPEYANAYFYKSLLYQERRKLTKDEAKRKELEKLAKEANDKGMELQKKQEAAAPAPTT